MPESPSADVSFAAGTITVTSGLYDTDDGIKLQVAGDVYPRLHFTPQGNALVGDGTLTPVMHNGSYVANFIVADADLAGGVFTTLDLMDISGGFLAENTARATLVGLRVLILSGDDAGSIWAVTASGACTLVATPLGGASVWVSGATAPLIATNTALGGGTDTTEPATGFSPVSTNPGSSTYIPLDGAVWDTDPANIKEAIDRIAAVVGDTVPIP